MLDNLTVLRKRMDDLKTLYDGTQMANVAGKTTEELVSLDIASHRAKRAWLDAYTEYQRALEAAVAD